MVLTTHELGEAERLADRVVIIDRRPGPGRGDAGRAGRRPSRRRRPLHHRPRPRHRGAGRRRRPRRPRWPRRRPGRYRLRPPHRDVRVPAVVAAIAGVAGRARAWRSAIWRTGQSLEEAYLAITGARGAPGPPGDGATAPATGGGAGSPAGRRRHGGGDEAARRPAPGRADHGRSPTGRRCFLTLGHPRPLPLFFSAVHVLPTGTRHPVDFLVPGILALAVMATAMTALGIGTGFERGYGVLKRLGSTPLGRPRLLGAKIVTVVVVELVQAAVLVAVGSPWGGTRGVRGHGRPGRGGRRWPWCWARWPSGASACCWPAPSSPGQPGAWSTPSSWCCCCSGGMLIPLAKLPGWLEDLSKPAAGRRPGRRPPRHARARDRGHRPGLGGAGRLGRGRAGGRRPHLPLGMTAAPTGRSDGRAGAQPDDPASRWSQRRARLVERPGVAPDDDPVGVDEERVGFALRGRSARWSPQSASLPTG